MFELAAASLWLDAFGVPTAVDGSSPGRATWTLAGRALTWEPSSGGGPLKRYELGALPVYAGRIRSEPPSGAREPIAALSHAGEECAYVWRTDTGVSLPFDPDEAVSALLTERYLSAETGAASARAKTAACAPAGGQATCHATDKRDEIASLD